MSLWLCLVGLEQRSSAHYPDIRRGVAHRIVIAAAIRLSKFRQWFSAEISRLE